MGSLFGSVVGTQEGRGQVSIQGGQDRGTYQEQI